MRPVAIKPHMIPVPLTSRQPPAWQRALRDAVTDPAELLTLLGLGLNALTLGGLAIAVGLLVDAGVIMVENLTHRLHEIHSDDPVIRRRKLPDPAVTPNAGSFFHNPVVDAARAAALATDYPDLPCYPQADGRVKLAAGWLIEKAGWKGKSLGPVGMYERQALVLVNHGGATGADVRRTMAAVQAAVHARFTVDLIPEPVFL